MAPAQSIWVYDKDDDEDNDNDDATTSSTTILHWSQNYSTETVLWLETQHVLLFAAYIFFVYISRLGYYSSAFRTISIMSTFAFSWLIYLWWRIPLPKANTLLHTQLFF